MFRAITVSSTSAVLSWAALSPEDHNGFVIGYAINVTNLQSGERMKLFSNSTMLTVHNLQPHTLYGCVSAAVNNAGLGPASVALQLETLEAGKYYVHLYTQYYRMTIIDFFYFKLLQVLPKILWQPQLDQEVCTSPGLLPLVNTTME